MESNGVEERRKILDGLNGELKAGQLPAGNFPPAVRVPEYYHVSTTPPDPSFFVSRSPDRSKTLKRSISNSLSKFNRILQQQGIPFRLNTTNTIPPQQCSSEKHPQTSYQGRACNNCMCRPWTCSSGTSGWRNGIIPSI
jgi:hypothetical protein